MLARLQHSFYSGFANSAPAMNEGIWRTERLVGQLVLDTHLTMPHHAEWRLRFAQCFHWRFLGAQDIYIGTFLDEGTLADNR
jgi:hypothetical protein